MKEKTRKWINKWKFYIIFIIVFIFWLIVFRIEFGEWWNLTPLCVAGMTTIMINMYFGNMRFFNRKKATVLTK